MTLTEILTAQLTDPLRIGLLVGLFITMLRTQHNSGTLVPLAIGAVFVAVILPVTMQTAQAAPMATLVGVGLIANAIWLGGMLAGWALYRRLKP